MEIFKTGLNTASAQPRYGTAALIALFAMGTLLAVPGMRAADASATPVSSAASASKVDFSLASPIDHMSFSSSMSSSNDAADNTVDAERDSLATGFDPSQPPPRRRTYGRPRYADKWHNADGSTKIAFEVGGGFNAPAGSTAHFQTIGYKFSVGGGLNFSKAFGVLAQFDWDNMGIPRGPLLRVLNDYQAANPDVDFSGFDGSTHLWSFTVNPIINFQGSGHAGAYIIGGLGYYHKTTSFTLPTVQVYCDYYYGCSAYESNQEIDHYTSGAFGVNGGVGLTYKLSNFGSSRLFAEARYVWVNNDQSTTVYYQPNSYRTGYFPVTMGIRW